MSNLTDLKQTAVESESLKQVIDALGEISTIHFRQTKTGVEHNTLFFSEIGRVYRALRATAQKRQIALNQASDKNGQNISLLLTSNSQFHGGLDSELSSYFLTSIAKYPSDLIVVGQSGEKFLKAIGFSHPYSVVLFKNDFPTTEEVLNLMERVRQYSKILVYHSKFVTILDQQVEVSELVGSGDINEADKDQIEYLIEPELPKMMAFFEGQILTSLFQSVFLESELAKTAARMVAMDTAGLNAEKIIEEQKGDVLKARKALQNLRILETFVQIRSITREGAEA